jgi:WD40 repeat protein
LIVLGSVDDRSGLYLWTPNEAPAERFPLVPSIGSLACIGRDARRFSYQSADWSIHVGEVETGKILFTTACDSQARSLALSSDGSFVAAGCGNQVTVWNVESGKSTFTKSWKRPEGESQIHSLAFGPGDHRLVAGTNNRELWMLNLRSGSESMTQVEGCPDSLEFSRDGSQVIVGSRTGVLIVDGSKWAIVKKLGLDSTQGSCISRQGRIGLSPDGRRVASAFVSSHKVTLWDVKTGTRVSSGEGHEATVQDLSFSSTGALMASGGDDETTRIWDLRKSAELRVYREGAAVHRVALSSDASRVLSINSEHVIRVREVSTGSLIFSLDSVLDAAFMNSGDQVLGILSGGTVVLWDRSGKIVKRATLEEVRTVPRDEVRILSVDPEGPSLVWLCREKVLEWNFSTGTLDTVKQEVLRAVIPPGERMLFVLSRNADPRVSQGLGKRWNCRDLPESLGSPKAITGNMSVLAMKSSANHIDFLEPAPLSRIAGIELESCTTMQFVPGQCTLATGTDRGPIMIVRVLELLGEPHSLQSATVSESWDELGSEDSPKAFKAVARLSADPAASVPFIGDKLMAGLKNEDEIRLALGQLEDQKAEVRTRAFAKLRDLDIAPLLEETEARSSSSDFRLIVAELKQLLVEARQPDWRTRRDREIDRGIQVLELIRGPEAQGLLRKLSIQAPSARVKVQASKASIRLTGGP